MTMRDIHKGVDKSHCRSLILLGAAAVIALVSVWTGCQGKQEEKVITRPAVTGVTVTVVTTSQVDQSYKTTGTIHSAFTSIISSRVMGAVTSLRVKEGDTVKKGQLLMTIDDRDASERVKAASMGLEAARQNMALSETTWKRYRSLFVQKALAQQEMDQIETQRNVAAAEYQRTKAMAEEARTYLAFTHITAPGAGVVTGKKIDAGSMAAPGMPLLEIEGMGDEYVEIAVDEGLSGRIKAGIPVQVKIDALGKSLQGHVREIVPSVDPSSRTFIAKVGLEGEHLRPGLFARVSVPVGKKHLIVVPEKAVVRKGELTGVYVVDAGGVITYRLIRTGSTYQEGMEILSGLSPNERIITDGVDHAQDGGIIHPEQTK
jgi:RND family efflux transporter MFP subunit